MSGPFLRRPQPWIGCQACLSSSRVCLRRASTPTCRQATILHFQRCMPVHSERATRALARGATTETPRANVVLRPQTSMTAPQADNRTRGGTKPRTARVAIYLVRRMGRTATPARHSQRQAFTAMHCAFALNHTLSPHGTRKYEETRGRFLGKSFEKTRP